MTSAHAGGSAASPPSAAAQAQACGYQVRDIETRVRDMPTVYVNDKPVEIGNGKLNCIEAAELAGVFIPSYCWHPALSVVASCRMCLVEVGQRNPDGTVAIMPKV